MNYKTITYKGIGTAGFIGSNYSGTTSITGVSAIDLTKFQAYKIKLNLEKFSTINKVKLLVYPIGTSKPIIFLKQTSSLTNNVGTSLGGAICNLDGVYEFDITELFVDNMNGNKFFALTSKTAMQMYNHDSPTESKRPTLVVEYIEHENGLCKEQIVAFGVGDNMEFNLDVRSGASKFSKQLLSYGGENMPFNLSLAFNAINKTEVTSVGMPSGWKFNYQHKLVESGSDYIYTDGRGEKHRFKKALNSTTVFYDVAGIGLIMIVGSGYKIIDGYNNEMHFNTNGLLTNIVKKHGSNAITTTISFDN